MLIIKVWCLPKLSQAALRSLHKKIVKTVVGVKPLCLQNEEDMLVLFPTDMMKYGLGSEILAEISGFSMINHLTKMQYDGLTYAIGKVLEQKFPKAKIGCVGDEFNTQVSAYWKE